MLQSHPATVTTVATINKTQIVVIENGEKRVAVKPLCEALGIDFSAQLQRLKRDEILSSVVVMITTTGSDGKQYEMVTIPYKYAFGWLFTIDTSKVRPEAKDFVLKYKMECYDALYNHFVELDEYIKYRDELSAQIYLKVEAARDDFKLAKNKLEEYKEEFAAARKLTLEDWREQRKQLEIDFENSEEGGE
ncbi:MAG: phage antirepressor N-terminal domain-containing protein [Bacteroidales bacterium]|nr:phage antirepressor N-terminal domain-containing protein [Bacteroidales bacterium]